MEIVCVEWLSTHSRKEEYYTVHRMLQVYMMAVVKVSNVIMNV